MIAHRGASSALADNSPEAFERAIDDRADMIEFDVRQIGDGRLIVFHDAEVGGEAVSGMSHAELAARLGRRPPLLAEVLEQAAGRIGIDMELKEDGEAAERAVAAVRAAFDPADVLVTSFLPAVVHRVRKAWPASTVGLLRDTNQAADLRDAVAQAQVCGASVAVVDAALMSRAGLASAVDAQVEVVVWTVNDPAEMSALIALNGLGGLITDVPGAAVAVRDQLRGTA